MSRVITRASRYQPRRIRQVPALRELLRETRLSPSQIVAPLFVTVAKRREEISSMPGVYRLPLADAVSEAKGLARLGVGSVLLFGIPARKDAAGSGAYAENGIVQQAVRAIKKVVSGLTVITDVCLCEYTNHGHCGIVKPRPGSKGGAVDNAATLPVLGRTAVSHAKAGADMVAPSAMMDGQVAAIRQALGRSGFDRMPIMSYAAKYASALYGPFREAVASAPKFGDRRGYQMDPPNVQEALREVALDIEEGADLVMVKPAIVYLDVLKTVKEKFHWPTAAYQVSGEYSIIKAAAARGWVDEKHLVLELITAMKRAGADLIITYYARPLAEWLSNGKRGSDE